LAHSDWLGAGDGAGQCQRAESLSLILRKKDRAWFLVAGQHIAKTNAGDTNPFGEFRNGLIGAIRRGKNREEEIP
jgi:hypothetical protein